MIGVLIGVLLGALLQAAVLVGAYLVWGQVADRDGSADPLGPGLVAFFILVAVSGLWSMVDGSRLGLGRALLTWLITAVVAAVAITLLDAHSPAWDDVVFFGVLMLGPALVGSAIGSVIRRAADAGTSTE